MNIKPIVISQKLFDVYLETHINMPEDDLTRVKILETGENCLLVSNRFNQARKNLVKAELDTWISSNISGDE